MFKENKQYGTEKEVAVLEEKEIKTDRERERERKKAIKRKREKHKNKPKIERGRDKNCSEKKRVILKTEKKR